jgi:LAO/AO transport system kinase
VTIAESAIETLVGRLRSGDRRALARTLSIVESGSPAERRRVMALLPASATRGRTIGITGPPGVGKSTLTSALAAGLRACHRAVAILSIDPSSPYSGGALLGDRVRMGTHHTDPGVYIRSMASRGQLGGLSVATPQAVAVLDAAGFDDIVVETVGVGQSEVQIAQTADTTILVLAPGLGDHIQIAKAGVLEIADILVVNKSENPGAQKLASELRAMASSGPRTATAVTGTHTEPGWVPRVVSTVAVRDEGIEALVEAIDAHADHAARVYLPGAREQERMALAIQELVLEMMRRRMSSMAHRANSPLRRLAEQVLMQGMDAYEAAELMLGASVEHHVET